jgi:predicted dithiol-disulfide oxidoreductase (DUF899 family)
LRALKAALAFAWSTPACRGSSLGADQVGNLAHLNARDTTLAYASRAPQADIARLKARMAWEMPWYTLTDGFDADFDVDQWHGHNMFFSRGDTLPVAGAHHGEGELRHVATDVVTMPRLVAASAASQHRKSEERRDSHAFHRALNIMGALEVPGSACGQSSRARRRGKTFRATSERR